MCSKFLTSLAWFLFYTHTLTHKTHTHTTHKTIHIHTNAYAQTCMHRYCSAPCQSSAVKMMAIQQLTHTRTPQMYMCKCTDTYTSQPYAIYISFIPASVNWLLVPCQIKVHRCRHSRCCTFLVAQLQTQIELNPWWYLVITTHLTEGRIKLEFLLFHNWPQWIRLYYCKYLSK